MESLFLLAFSPSPLPHKRPQLPDLCSHLSCQGTLISHACSGRRGLSLAWIQLEVEGKKPIGKETFHPSLGTETTGRLCFLLSQPRTWSPRVSPAKSIQPGASRVQRWGEGTITVFTPLVGPDRTFSARHSYVVLSKCLLF